MLWSSNLEVLLLTPRATNAENSDHQRLWKFGQALFGIINMCHWLLHPTPTSAQVGLTLCNLHWQFFSCHQLTQRPRLHNIRRHCSCITVLRFMYTVEPFILQVPFWTLFWKKTSRWRTHDHYASYQLATYVIVCQIASHRMPSYKTEIFCGDSKFHLLSNTQLLVNA